MVLNMSEIISWVPSMTHGHDPVSVWILGHSPFHWPVLAQSVTDPDVLGQMQRAWNNFIKTGQVWALLIGIFFGYVFRGFTA